MDPEDIPKVASLELKHSTHNQAIVPNNPKQSDVTSEELESTLQEIDSKKEKNLLFSPKCKQRDASHLANKEEGKSCPSPVDKEKDETQQTMEELLIIYGLCKEYGPGSGLDTGNSSTDNGQDIIWGNFSLKRQKARLFQAIGPYEVDEKESDSRSSLFFLCVVLRVFIRLYIPVVYDFLGVYEGESAYEKAVELLTKPHNLWTDDEIEGIAKRLATNPSFVGVTFCLFF